MWSIIKTIIISFILILVLHYGYQYIKTNYSYKKTKDLVGTQAEKYKNILSEVLENKKKEFMPNPNDYLSLKEKQTMEKSLLDHMNHEIENL
jgi:predicted negative regulator of RcsB-dependent stress response